MKKDLVRFMLFVLLPILLLIGFLVFSVIEFVTNKNSTITGINDTMMLELTRVRGDDFKAICDSNISYIQSLAYGFGDKLSDIEKAQDSLSVVAEKNPAFERFSIITPEGLEYCCHEEVRNLGGETFWRDGFEGNEGLSVVRGEETEIVFYAPLKAAGEVYGVLAGYPEPFLSKPLLVSSFMDYDSEAYLISREGVVVASPNDEDLGKAIGDVLSEGDALASFPSIADGVGESEGATKFQFGENGERWFYAIEVNDSLLFVQSFRPETFRRINEVTGTFGRTLSKRISTLVFFTIVLLFFHWLFRLRGARKETRYIVEALGEDYGEIVRIDKKNDTIAVIKQTHLDLKAIHQPAKASLFIPQTKKYMVTDIGEEKTPAFISNLEKGFSSVEKGEKYYTFVQDFFVNGKEKNIQFSVLCSEKYEKVVFICTRDITSVVQKERQEKEDLAAALEKAEAATRAKSRFLANISHDIRTPMNAIIGYTDLALKHSEDRALVDESMRKVSSAGSHLMSLVNDILDMSRIEGGKASLEEKLTSLPVLISAVKAMALGDIKAKDMDFHFIGLQLYDENVWCDSLKLSQVLLNLLSNSIKYTEERGKISLTIQEEREPGAENATYFFKVQDNGIGMDEEFLKNIFEPFEREKNSTVSGIVGSGLGMSICKSLVDLMGGTIDIKSTKGKGTEVTVALSLRIADTSPYSEGVAAFKGKKALVVGETGSTDSLMEIFSRLGLFAESNGYKVDMEKLPSYDIVLVERNFMLEFGFDALKTVRSSMRKDALLLVAAYIIEDIQEKTFGMGVDAYVSKPVFASDMERILSTCQGNQTPSRKDFSRHRVLLVEDNEINRDIATLMLQDLGLVVESVCDGEKAVERIAEVDGGYYDLVFMDIQMPVMDGYEATRAIRVMAEEKKRKLPIVAMTANAFQEDKEKAAEAGMDGHLAKPVDAQELVGVLQKYLC